MTRSIEVFGKSIGGFAILGIFQLVGAALHRVGVPLPSGVLGLLLFFGALLARIVQLNWVESAAEFTVRHMLLLFIPLLVGLTQIRDELRRNGLALLASTVVSFLAVLLTTGSLGEKLLPKNDPAQAFEVTSIE
jgi:holin-like protein